MKIASWFLTLLLAVPLLYSLAQVPSIGPDSALRVHVESRYQQRAQQETGIESSRSKASAVLFDYRSLDLWVGSLLLVTSSMGVLLLFSKPVRHLEQLPAFLLLLAGSLLALGLGFFPVSQGDNFLDYEALAGWAASSRARPDGAFLLLLGTLLSLGGLLMLLNSLRHNGGKGGR